MANPHPSKSFKAGDARINRRGRTKKGETLAEKFRDALAETLDGDYTKLDSLIDTVLKMALKGDQKAIEFMLERGFGKVPERIESVNQTVNYDFTNLPLEERVKLLEQIRSARRTDATDPQ